VRRDTIPAELPIAEGATAVPERAVFETLARRDDVPGALGVREVKLLMLGVDGDAPQLYFLNTTRYVYHYDFAVEALGLTLSLREFNQQTYFRDARRNLAGTILAHDRFEDDEGGLGLYALEFWPTDPVKANHVGIAFRAVTQAMPFAAGRIAYHPAGDTQEALYATEEAALRELGVRVVLSEELFGDISYSPLNLGEGFGMLRLVDGREPGARPPSGRDVVIFRSLPNDLARVGGVISEAPQTPLSHVNLKARQNDTPNAYVKEASRHPRVVPLLDQLVRYTVGADDFALAPATPQEAEAFFEQMRPDTAQRPPRDLTQTAIVDLDELAHASSNAYGAKTANMAELLNILDRGTVPDGYGIPFFFYDCFMRENRLYDEAAAMICGESFVLDPGERDRSLRDFRRRLRDAPVPEALNVQLCELQARFPTEQPIRCRSSTNNEDLPGFNGAGLYDSYTHRQDEGELGNTIKQVWASLWNFRAFEERDFHRVDHFVAAMGVLVTPNFDDELANGVAVTKNIYDPNWPGFYVNVQVGESLVTNPDPDATPDEFLVAAIGENFEYETQYIKRSSLLDDAAGQRTVLGRTQIEELVGALELIQTHFAQVYAKQDDPTFAMDVEFKFDRDAKLVVKQARPWVD